MTLRSCFSFSLACRCGSLAEETVPFQVQALGSRAGGPLAREVFHVKASRLDDVLVVEERFRVANGPVLRLFDVMLLAHVVVPVHSLGEETIRTRKACRENGAALLLVSHAREVLGQFENVQEFHRINHTVAAEAPV